MTPANSWLILSIDAVSSVNQMTRKTLENTHFLDKDIAVLESNSIEQAKQLLQDNTEVAVVLLDNMNGSQSESLSFIRFVRDTLKNYRTRIILRTGGNPPINPLV